jgi:ABC-type nitrate/sulfonate/bicarbonate transport system permease component
MAKGGRPDDVMTMTGPMAMTARQGHRPPVWALRLTGGVLLAALWELAGRQSQSLLLPSFSETMAALAVQGSRREMWAALATSNEALVLGFGAALVLGIPLGFLLGRRTGADIVLHPYLLLAVVLPTSALVPVIFMLGGLGLGARVLVVCIFSFPVVAECARTAVREVDGRLRDMAKTFGATPAQEWSHVTIPAALPGVITGVRLALARAIEGMVVVELLLVAVGIGGLLLEYQGNFEAAHVYAVIIVIMAEAALLTLIGRRLERRFSPLARAATP